MADYDANNVFGKILRGEIPSTRIHEDADCIVIMDAMPQSRGHCLVIPRTPSRNLLDASDETLSKLIPMVARIARAAKTGLKADGVIVSQFNETPAGQTVFHLHFHVIPRYDGVPLERHSSGMADPSLLEEHAALIRAALASLTPG